MWGGERGGRGAGVRPELPLAEVRVAVSNVPETGRSSAEARERQLPLN